ncbi:MAG: TetR/AcrR family transcriptional regulator [Syntrophaceae bacterium]
MPKAARNGAEVSGVKGRILDTALQLLIDDGFVHFSMRRLAAKLGMTAANIYNYYRNKDELYLRIQTRGFEMLSERFAKADNRTLPVNKRILGMMRAYIDFGVHNPEYYEIMFSRNTPKYADYVGTDMEPVAFHEKQTALKAAELTLAVFAELGMEADEARFRLIQVWSMLNGIVNLYNSRVLQEVDDHAEQTMDRMVAELMLPFKALRKEKNPR